ncbi:metallophosphoesterase [Oscillatoria sp. FACHB-1406]|uniref:metallophosphoesterase family protein n=1 Tax=Oscillatoria sp. FACHB-1406 TaxID=2692846 RepID=UPI0016880CE2|nr:metallophosphoesterase [Oscillatoria sp. FACHB-1406]MBD2576115.1 metallophosphoesterase [Oscillatoria sp. FACHB-1406]
MKFVSEPPIATKIGVMKQRVRWQEGAIAQRQIDQTRLSIDDGGDRDPEFSFLVIGDSGTGNRYGQSPQHQVAELLEEERSRCRFLLHTGDVVYLVGSSEYYRDNFIKPYRKFLVGGDRVSQIAYDRMTFNFPFLPVPGNHDYYDLPFVYGLLAQMAWPLRRLLRSKIDIDVGWHGSRQGDAYARAFLDYLQNYNLPGQLDRHLDLYYTVKTPTGRCLRYQPGIFTRLPNRYYTFCYGGIDFFALDSNTFNAPTPIPDTQEGDVRRSDLAARLQELEQQQQQILEEMATMDRNDLEQLDELDDAQVKLQQIEEMKLDIEKQLNANETTATDIEQLHWLEERLIESWYTESVRGRVIFFHHPPYVTEATKWGQAQTLEVRNRLRAVLDRVARTVGQFAENRPIVDLVLNGHAHCLEYLRTGDTGRGDAGTNWIVCGGSGYSLRRQRSEGPDLMEDGEWVARSHFFLGRMGRGKNKQRPYSAIRIDVGAGTPPQMTVQPLAIERTHSKWQRCAIDPFQLPNR